MIATTDDEKQKLREGGRRLAQIMRTVAAAVRPGVRTDEVDALAERLIRENGDIPALIGYTPEGAKRPYPATLCVSVNDAVVHGIPNERPRTFVEGDLVGLDCVMIHEGVFVDTAISVFAGSGDEDGWFLIRATEEALMAGIRAALPGGHIGDISAAIEAVGVRHGLGIVYELGGHGVGARVHEEPYVPNVGDQGTGPELAPGLVIAIEPMFTLGTPRVRLLKDGYTFVTRDGSRAAHAEHTIMISNSGPAEIITEFVP